MFDASSARAFDGIFLLCIHFCTVRTPTAYNGVYARARRGINGRVERREAGGGGNKNVILQIAEACIYDAAAPAKFEFFSSSNNTRVNHANHAGNDVPQTCIRRTYDGRRRDSTLQDRFIRVFRVCTSSVGHPVVGSSPGGASLLPFERDRRARCIRNLVRTEIQGDRTETCGLKRLF